MGVDAIAHEHSFPRTIAVLAGSLDVGFVQTNRKLIERIRTEGLLLSEYEASTPPKPWSFVHRNRLVTALADAVVVMEADQKSGSMTSARFALQQRRPLYVPPHRLGESAGTNGLLQRGEAQPLWETRALLDELAIRPAMGDQTHDELLYFCADRPTYEAALERFGARLMEYELSGRIAVVEGRVEVCRGDTRA
jgi:DNA processing protein